MPTEHRPSVLAFDVYGTLIDPFRMEDHLRVIFGVRAKEATELWRNKQLEYSFRRALMKKYENFDVCTAQALRFVSRQLEVPLTDETMRNLLDQYLRLPRQRWTNWKRANSRLWRARMEPNTLYADCSIAREYSRNSVGLSAWTPFARSSLIRRSTNIWRPRCTPKKKWSA